MRGRRGPKTQTWVFLLVGMLGACTSPAMDPDLSLHDRFVLTALTLDDGTPRERMRRWDKPINVGYQGPPQYHQRVAAQLAQLAEITGLAVTMDAEHPNTFVEISDRETDWTCHYRFNGFHARIHIWSDLPAWEIRQCIAQEMTQALGPGGDLDGPFGSRQDTVFASYGGAQELTAQDIAVLRILYDDRLRNEMPRDEVLAILPEIVADVEAGR